MFFTYQAKYGNDPVKLFDFFHGVVSKLRELVISATTVSKLILGVGIESYIILNESSIPI